MTRVCVDAYQIRVDKKNGTVSPVVEVHRQGSVTRCREVRINGPSRIAYRPLSPMEGGATVWIETDGEVEIVKT